MKTLPTIDVDRLSVAAPCDADWDAMSPSRDPRVRRCGDCDENVYRLTELTRAEIEELILEHEGNVCVRFFQRADGTVLTADCAIGVAARVRRRVLSAWNKIAAACLALIPAFGTGCQISPPPGDGGAGCGVVMGKVGWVAPPPPPPPPRELGPALHELQPEVEIDGPCFPPAPRPRGRG